MNPVLVAENDEYRLEVHLDEYASDPLEEDTLGTFVCWHQKYNIGQPHDFESPREFLEWLADELGMASWQAETMPFDDLVAWIEKRCPVFLPLYLYDHSGLRIQAHSFGDPWDSGQVGWVYVTPERMRLEYGKQITRKRVEAATRCVLGEVEAYDQYLSGEVYGYELFRKRPVNGDPEGAPGYELEDIDSCWGFYGDDWYRNGLMDNLPPECRHLVDKLALAA